MAPSLLAHGSAGRVAHRDRGGRPAPRVVVVVALDLDDREVDHRAVTRGRDVLDERAARGARLDDDVRRRGVACPRDALGVGDPDAVTSLALLLQPLLAA